MPRFQIRTRLSWSFSAQAGVGRPHRAPTAVRLARAGVLRALLRAATRRAEPVPVGRHRFRVSPRRRLRRR
ncbi:hypothetical protein AB0D49_37625 [Streptomyces sp. NPDC048290]|uniref:hypothetical protein n=1 Tax=Streptomyces sp. NPDC048290 TaxID=3155811 RepID=UPI0034153661